MTGVLRCYNCDRLIIDHPVGRCPFPPAPPAPPTRTIPEYGPASIHDRPHQRNLIMLGPDGTVGHYLTVGGRRTLCGREVRDKAREAHEPNPICKRCSEYRGDRWWRNSVVA